MCHHQGTDHHLVIQAHRRSHGSGRGHGSVQTRLATEGDDDEKSFTQDVPDIEPPKPKFEPKNPVGPRNYTTLAWTPLSLFKLFFSSSVTQTIINTTTNGNAKQHLTQGKCYKQSPLSMDSFYIFLSTIIFSALVHIQRPTTEGESAPTISLSQELHNPGQIWSNLSDVTQEENEGAPKYERLFKIKPLYNQIVTACTTISNLTEKSLSTRERLPAKPTLYLHIINYTMYIVVLNVQMFRTAPKSDAHSHLISFIFLQ